MPQASQLRDELASLKLEHRRLTEDFEQVGVSQPCLRPQQLQQSPQCSRAALVSLVIPETAEQVCMVHANAQ